MKADYQLFVESKQFNDVETGFHIAACDVPIEGARLTLKAFQSEIVRWALGRGRAAIFANTGLGKTAMQSTWAQKVMHHCNLPVLIVAPLCVSKQTVTESEKFGVQVQYVRSQSQVSGTGVYVTNYEMLDQFDPAEFGGIVLDESSILKDRNGKTRNKIISDWKLCPYRLSCTATPSPNDYMELGNQAEFLGVMGMDEMLAMFFTHDGGDTSKWRLKGHGKTKFWEWLSTWAVTIRKPSDLGFSDEGYDLPALHMIEHIVDGHFGVGLFTDIAQTLNERRSAKKQTLSLRVSEVSELVNGSKDPWIVWCHTNDESALLAASINDSVEVKGADSIDHKEKSIERFLNGEVRVLVTKPSIAGMGLNLQHCAHMAFVGLDDSFEQMYQAIRRCWRFGQNREVECHLVTSESLGAIKANVERKEAQMEEMQASMVDHMKTMMQKTIRGTTMEKSQYKREKQNGKGWEMHLGDSVDVLGEMPESTVDYTIFSPPFASLYTYSNSDYDMGNVKDDAEFMAQFGFLVDELLRVTKHGRLLSFHCMNLPTTKARDGFIGIKDFRGDLIRLFTSKGWIYHSEVCIWKDPVTAMQRTKALGLLHKQIKKDSAMSRQGIADYLVTMRKPGENPDPVTHTNESFPVGKWQNYASPVWMDINPSRTIGYREGRDDDDERHICPLQLDVIERAIDLWTNPNDLVLSPFGGIGSEPVTAIKMGRRAVAVELKESYFRLAIKNLKEAENRPVDMFAVA